MLHPTRYTKRPAVLRRLHAAVRHQVGVHLSPADENQYLHGVYANGSTRARRTIPTRTAGDDRTPGRFRTLDATGYGAHMLNTLYEVLTEYGPVDEVWFDGAQGHARENEWNVIPVKENQYGRTDWALSCDAADQGSRAARVRARPNTACLQWRPAECDVSIRAGRFYHADQRPKSVAELTEIWYGSADRGAVLLLDERVDRELPYDLALDGRTTSVPNQVTVELPADTEVDRIRLAEVIREGRQVEAFVVEALRAGTRTQAARAQTMSAG